MGVRGCRRKQCHQCLGDARAGLQAPASLGKRAELTSRAALLLLTLPLVL